MTPKLEWKQVLVLLDFDSIELELTVMCCMEGDVWQTTKQRRERRRRREGRRRIMGPLQFSGIKEKIEN
jgi:hypothetical protein